LSLVTVGNGYTSAVSLPVRGRVLLGRGAGVDIQLDDPGVSRGHAWLHIAGGIEIEDLGSTNGTYVREARIVPGYPAPVHLGEAIELASTVLVLEDPAAANPLRRIWTHGYFEGRLEDECRRTRISGLPFAVISVHVERVLPGRCPIAALLLGALSPTDTLATRGPQDYEILIVHPRVPSVPFVVRRIRDQMCRRGVRVHIGCARFPRRGVSHLG
jgi:hypothetical protein